MGRTFSSLAFAVAHPLVRGVKNDEWLQFSGHLFMFQIAANRGGPAARE